MGAIIRECSRRDPLLDNPSDYYPPAQAPIFQVYLFLLFSLIGCIRTTALYSWVFAMVAYDWDTVRCERLLSQALSSTRPLTCFRRPGPRAVGSRCGAKGGGPGAGAGPTGEVQHTVVNRPASDILSADRPLRLQVGGLARWGTRKGEGTTSGTRNASKCRDNRNRFRCRFTRAAGPER